MPMTIYWNEGIGMKVAHCEHTLCFEGKGKWRTVTMMMNRKKVNAMLGLEEDD